MGKSILVEIEHYFFFLHRDGENIRSCVYSNTFNPGSHDSSAGVNQVMMSTSMEVLSGGLVSQIFVIHSLVR